MELPKEFIDYTSSLFGEERWKNYLASFEESVPVSVRFNPFKMPKEELFPETEKTPVPWCRNAFYLAERPNFTLDPLLHAGVYYVQEAGSMFLDEVLRQLKIENGKLKNNEPQNYQLSIINCQFSILNYKNGDVWF